MKLFSANVITQCPEFALQCAIDLPGWSHCDSKDWEKIYVAWYPFEWWTRKIYFHSKNRSVAAKQCTRLGIQIRDLDGGK